MVRPSRCPHRRARHGPPCRRGSQGVDDGQRPGGRRRDAFAGEHTVVEPPARLHYTEATAPSAGAAPAGPSTEVQVRLEAFEGGTLLTLTHLGVPAGSPGETGWSMALDELERLLDR
ncbi:SRPBCC domain-containing protein [Jannaschia sp. R86511]|uniref:SRPBCC family protein n=1 Tax=Jannaschia sp. R86511 TaxID=3093853 RepID=UPI0036D3773E